VAYWVGSASEATTIIIIIIQMWLEITGHAPTCGIAEY